MKKLLPHLHSLFVLVGVFILLVGLGCQSLGVWSSTAKTDMQKVSTALAPLIGDAQKAIKAIQANYPFWCAIAQGTLQVAGVKVTQADMDAAKSWLALADTSLGILGPVNAAVANNTAMPAVDPGLVQNAIAQVKTALPQQTAAALANPAVKVLYQAYLAGQTNVPAPGPAAVPTP